MEISHGITALGQNAYGWYLELAEFEVHPSQDSAPLILGLPSPKYRQLVYMTTYAILNRLHL